MQIRLIEQGLADPLALGFALEGAAQQGDFQGVQAAEAVQFEEGGQVVSQQEVVDECLLVLAGQVRPHHLVEERPVVAEQEQVEFVAGMFVVELAPAVGVQSVPAAEVDLRVRPRGQLFQRADRFEQADLGQGIARQGQGGPCRERHHALAHHHGLAGVGHRLEATVDRFGFARLRQGDPLDLVRLGVAEGDDDLRFAGERGEIDLDQAILGYREALVDRALGEEIEGRGHLDAWLGRAGGTLQTLFLDFLLELVPFLSGQPPGPGPGPGRGRGRRGGRRFVGGAAASFRHAGFGGAGFPRVQQQARFLQSHAREPLATTAVEDVPVLVADVAAAQVHVVVADQGGEVGARIRVQQRQEFVRADREARADQVEARQVGRVGDLDPQLSVRRLGLDDAGKAGRGFGDGRYGVHHEAGMRGAIDHVDGDGVGGKHEVVTARRKPRHGHAARDQAQLVAQILDHEIVARARQPDPAKAQVVGRCLGGDFGGRARAGGHAFGDRLGHPPPEPLPSLDALDRTGRPRGDRRILGYGTKQHLARGIGAQRGAGAVAGEVAALEAQFDPPARQQLAVEAPHLGDHTVGGRHQEQIRHGRSPFLQRREG